jgi:hypothetical protein
MAKWILRASSVFALVGLLVPYSYVSRAQLPSALLQQPETIETVGFQPIVQNLDNPLLVTNAGDGSNRLFIVEKTGKIKVLQPGATSTTNFLDLSAKVVVGSEQGLLGLAFHPQYETNGRFFVFYVKLTDQSLQISEFQVSAGNPNVADATELPLLNILHPFADNHNGGNLVFGPDGFLYIGVGDGGNGNDPPNNAQNINLLLGKILRIDVDHPNGSVPYSSPATNPFFGVTPGADEIWMVGMRNPWRFSFDRANPTQMWIGDVGQSAREEIDRVDLTQNPVSGARNAGWRIFEGNNCTGLDPCTPLPQNYLPPIAEYGHPGGRCSITGGFVYRGLRSAFPGGAYVYADFCSGEIFTLNGGVATIVAMAGTGVTSFGEDEAGELYVCNAVGATHTVRRLVDLAGTIPRSVVADFDGDLKTDLSVFRSGNWFYRNSFDGIFQASAFGIGTDRPVPGDYDGDGKTDLAVWRDSDRAFYILNSGNGTFRAEIFGLSGDLPVPSDYDNDRKTDIAVFRPSESVWYYLTSSNGAFRAQAYGATGDQVVPGDYSGDSRSDFAVFRPSTGQWLILTAGSGEQTSLWGTSGDRPVPADYDGDGKLDLAVFRPSDGGWYIRRSSNGSLQSLNWGGGTDVPVPGDYDGDDRDDVAVFRGGAWYILLSSNGAFLGVSFGMGGDIPVPSAYKPQ